MKKWKVWSLIAVFMVLFYVSLLLMNNKQREIVDEDGLTLYSPQDDIYPNLMAIHNKTVIIGTKRTVERFNSLEKMKEESKGLNGFLFCSQGFRMGLYSEEEIGVDYNHKKHYCHFTRINIETPRDVLSVREKLIKYIWKSDLPSELPEKISKDIKDSFHDISEITNLKSIDRIVVNSDYGFNSIIYHFHPVNNNGRVMLYHYGHHDDKDIVKDSVLKTLIEEGFSVVTFFMPLHNENNKPVLNINGEDTQIEDHDMFVLLESEDFVPLKLFLNPIVVMVNYLEGKYDSISMMGISGGGWSTMTYAVLDGRIQRSYNIAGSIPLAILEPGRDYEQKVYRIFEIATSLDQYILASYGNDRRHTQTFILNDTCCFAGIDYIENPYGDVINENLNSLGAGEFEVMVDDSITGHYISDYVKNYILESEKL